MSWNFDISQAPRGRHVQKRRSMGTNGKESFYQAFEPERVILATKCRKVTLSHWLPIEERWVMLAKGEEPVAWMAWPEYPATKDTPHSATVTP